MSPAPSFKEARLDPAETTELSLGPADLELCRPGELRGFRKLRKLRIEGNADESLAFPLELLDLPLEELDLKGFPIPKALQWETLRHLSWESRSIPRRRPRCAALLTQSRSRTTERSARRSSRPPSGRSAPTQPSSGSLPRPGRPRPTP